MAGNTPLCNDKTRAARPLVEGSYQGIRYLLPNLQIFSLVGTCNQLATGIKYPYMTSLYCCLKLSTRFTANLSRLISVTYHPLYRKFDAYHIRKSKQVLKLHAAPWHIRPDYDQSTGLCGWSITYNLADCQRWFV